MGRERHKNLDRGVRQPLVNGEQRVRASRHGEPHKRRVRQVMTNADGKIVVSHTWVPVTAPFERKVAAGPTGNYGKPNAGDGNARVKKEKA